MILESGRQEGFSLWWADDATLGAGGLDLVCVEPWLIPSGSYTRRNTEAEACSRSGFWYLGRCAGAVVGPRRNRSGFAGRPNQRWQTMPSKPLRDHPVQASQHGSPRCGRWFRLDPALYHDLLEACRSRRLGTSADVDEAISGNASGAISRKRRVSQPQVDGAVFDPRMCDARARVVF